MFPSKKALGAVLCSTVNEEEFSRSDETNNFFRGRHCFQASIRFRVTSRLRRIQTMPAYIF